MSTILKWVLPYIITAANNYLPDVLEMLIKKIVKKDDKMGQIVLNIKSLTGVIMGSTAAFDLKEHGTQTKISDTTGVASISGLAAGTYPVTVSANGYTTSDNITITLPSDDSVVSQDIVLQSVQTVQAAIVDATSAVVAAVSPVIETAATSAATISTDPATAYTQVKADYTSLVSSIKSQKSAITAALKTGATAIIQAEGSALNITVTQKLNDSMHWYVTERSKIPSDSHGIPTGWDNLILWGKYTSMIASISIARKEGVTFLADVCTKLMNL